MLAGWDPPALCLGLCWTPHIQCRGEGPGEETSSPRITNPHEASHQESMAFHGGALVESCPESSLQDSSLSLSRMVTTCPMSGRDVREHSGQEALSLSPPDVLELPAPGKGLQCCAGWSRVRGLNHRGKKSSFSLGTSGISWRRSCRAACCWHPRWGTCSHT